MSEPFDAIFENGAFRPIDPHESQFSNGDRVRLIVNSTGNKSSNAAPGVLALAAQVFEGLSEIEADAVQRIATDRTRFFSSEDR